MALGRLGTGDALELGLGRRANGDGRALAVAVSVGSAPVHVGIQVHSVSAVATSLLRWGAVTASGWLCRT